MPNVTSTLTIQLIDDVSSPAAKVAKALEKATKSAMDIGKALEKNGISGRMAQQLSRLGASSKDIEKVAKSFTDFSKAAGIAAKASDWTKTDIQKVRSWENATISALRRVEQEQKNKARIEAQAARESARAQEQALRQQERAFQRMDRLHARHGVGRELAAYAAMGLGVHTVFDKIKDTIAAGASYQHERVALLNAGQGAAGLKESEEAARHTVAMLPTTTYAENLRVINETISAFGTLHHAIENLPFMQQTASVLHAAAGDKIADSPGEMAAKFAKVFEMRGTAIDSEVFREEAGKMVQAMAFSAGKFNPNEMFNFAQRAGRATLGGYDMRFLSRIAPTIVGDQSGDTAGTQAKMFRRLIMGTVSDSQQAQEWKRLGLLDPKLLNDKAGKTVSWKPGAVRGTDVAMRDPLEFMETFVLPAIQKAGIDVNNRQALSKELGLLVRKGTANDFVEALGQAASRRQLHLDEANINRAGTMQEMYQRNIAQDPTVGVKAFQASLENLMTTLSGPAMEVAAAGLTGIAKGVNVLAEALKDHPLLASATGVAAAAGGVYGTVKLSQMLLGFGLSSSAAALDGSAAALTSAAVALGGKGVLGAAGQAAGGAAMGFWGKLGMIARTSTPALMMEYLANMTTPREDREGAAYAKESQGVRARYGDQTLSAARARFAPWYDKRFSLDSESPNDASYVSRYMDEQRRMRSGYVPRVSMGESLSDIAGRYPRYGMGGSSRGWTAPSSGGGGGGGPIVDTSNIDAAQSKAQAAGDVMKAALNITAMPIVASDSIDAAIGKVRSLISLIQSVSTMSIKVPQAGQSLRGVQSDTGIGGVGLNGSGD